MEQSQQPELVWGGPAACDHVRGLTGEELPLATFYARVAKGIYGDAVTKHGSHLVLNPGKLRRHFGLGDASVAPAGRAREERPTTA
jgi:hypothetical protein